MIISNSDIGSLESQVTMVDGGFDPIHRGHIAYFRSAATLGFPVICCVAPDSYVSSKHEPLLDQMHRAEVIDAIKWIQYVYMSSTSTAEMLNMIRPRIYAKGNDWEGRLPAKELEVCNLLGIEIRYLDTVLDSSTRLLRAYNQTGNRNGH